MLDSSSSNARGLLRLSGSRRGLRLRRAAACDISLKQSGQSGTQHMHAGSGGGGVHSAVQTVHEGTQQKQVVGAPAIAPRTPLGGDAGCLTSPSCLGPMVGLRQGSFYAEPARLRTSNQHVITSMQHGIWNQHLCPWVCPNPHMIRYSGWLAAQAPAIWLLMS